MINKQFIYPHLTEQEINDYQDQKLPPAEMNRIERHMQECSFCEEAMNGASKMDAAIRTSAILRDLRKKAYGKFRSGKKINDLVGVNNLLVLLFILGIAIFVVYYFMRLK